MRNLLFTTAGYLDSQAKDEFERVFKRGMRSRLWGRLTGRQQALLNLTEVQTQVTIVARNHAGVRLVPIAQIRGSEGRSHDFDVEFRPCKEESRYRWVSVAVARQKDMSLPPVELVQIGDTYFVRDGHHRISVARAWGQREIEAEVTVWQCAVNSEQPVWGSTIFTN